MKSILLVHPPSWNECDTQALKTALNGSPLLLITGRSPDLVSNNDIVLLVLGEEYEPGLLRAVGERSRERGIDPDYAYPCDVAAKIASLLES